MTRLKYGVERPVVAEVWRALLSARSKIVGFLWLKQLRAQVNIFILQKPIAMADSSHQRGPQAIAVTCKRCCEEFASKTNSP